MATDDTTTTEDESSRYSRANILRSAEMYGEGFQSPGGVRSLDYFLSRAEVKMPVGGIAPIPDITALEVGCGLGGNAFHLATHYGAAVMGMDVAPAMVELANEAAEERNLTSKTMFTLGDIVTSPLPYFSKFDIVLTRDCFLYIKDKRTALQRIRQSLRHNGRLILVDFLRGDRRLSPAMRNYLEVTADNHYHLLTFNEYRRLLEALDLPLVYSEDITAMFADTLDRELQALIRRKVAFIKEWSQKDYDYLYNRWAQKVALCRAGDMGWGLFVAQAI